MTNSDRDCEINYYLSRTFSNVTANLGLNQNFIFEASDLLFEVFVKQNFVKTIFKFDFSILNWFLQNWTAFSRLTSKTNPLSLTANFPAIS